jgi:hypothetical protein
MITRRIAGGLLAAALAATPAALSAQTAPASPLAAYPGFGHNPTADEARYKREQAARERLISTCMREQGLSYTPSPPREANQGSRGNAARSNAVPVDPNERHAASLSAEERVRYYTALYGVPDPNDQSAQLWKPGTPTGGGCLGDAMRAMPGVYSARSALAEQFSDLRQSVLTDPAVTAAEGRWATCMRGKGFSFASPRAMFQAAEPPAAAQSADPACRTESGLKAAVEQARISREAAFVAANRDRLEGHKRALDAQPAAE